MKKNYIQTGNIKASYFIVFNTKSEKKQDKIIDYIIDTNNYDCFDNSFEYRELINQPNGLVLIIDFDDYESFIKNNKLFEKELSNIIINYKNYIN